MAGDRDCVDDSDLEGLDPYDLLDAEAGRIERYFASAGDAAWDRPSRCAGWNARDVLAHLLSGEDYHHACLDDRVAALFDSYAARGATDLATANEIGIRDRDGLSNTELLAAWVEADAETRRRIRERDGADVATSVGAYPARWQAFHLASELATHADDAGVPVEASEEAARTGWRVRFSRFAVREEKPGVELEIVPGGTRVRAASQEAVVRDHDFVEAVAGRLPPDHPIPAALRAALNTTP